MIIYADRACGVLYHFVKSRPKGYYLLPANVCPIVPFTILKAGGELDFVDISNENYCIDQSECLYRIQHNKNKYVGLIFVHTYGFYCSISNFANEVKSLNPLIAFIEDCCLSIPNILSFSLPHNVDLLLYSTGYAKYVEMGYGGFGICSETLLIADELSYNEQALVTLENKYKQAFTENEIIKNYSSLDWLNTKIITDQNWIINYKKNVLIKKKEVAVQKKLINSLYASLLPSSILFEDEFNNWRFNIFVKDPDKILKKIFSEGLFASRHYQPSAYLFSNKNQYINSDKLYGSIINLFNDFHINIVQVEQICKIINTLL